MSIKEFDAHKKIKRPVRVSFETKVGEEVSFRAQKKVKVPVHVKFKTRGK